MSSSPNRRRIPVVLLATFAAYLLLLLATYKRYQPPNPLEIDADSKQFSGQRAAEVLGNILREQEPHPFGSEANELVRSRIAATMRKLGYVVQTQRQFACGIYGVCGHATNIAASAEGAESDIPEILLMAHYDSVAAGPGTSDDGFGVATLIELARALKEQPQIQRRVGWLFTDGEEAGLIGAQAFVEHHPWAHHKPFVINVEARGTRGPSMMFETHAGNQRITSVIEKHVRRPVMSSGFYEVYRRMPNDTDFSVTRRHGMPGVNFANVRGVVDYHTPNDSLDRIDLGTLQHHGENALSLVEGLYEDPSAATLDTREAVFFDVFSFGILWWPATWAAPLAVCIFIVLCFALGVELKSKRASFSEVFWGAALLCVAPLISGAVMFGVPSVLKWQNVLPTPWPSQSLFLMNLFCCVGIVVSFLFTSLLAGKIGRRGMLLAFCFGWSSLAVVTSLFVVGFSYLFIVPSGLATAVLIASQLRSRLVSFGLLCFVTGVSVGALLLPTLWLAFDAVGFLAGPIYAAIASLLCLLACSNSAEFLPHASFRKTLKNSKRLSFGVCVVALIASLVSPSLSAGAPGRLSILHDHHTERGIERLLVSPLFTSLPEDLVPNVRLSKLEYVYSGSLPWEQAYVVSENKAPAIRADNALRVEAPERLILKSQRKTYHVKVVPRPNALRLHVVWPPNIELGRVHTLGTWHDVRRARPAGEGRTIAFVPSRNETLTLAFDALGKEPASIELFDITSGVPKSADYLKNIRADVYVPSNDGDLTIRSRSVSIQLQ